MKRRKSLKPESAKHRAYRLELFEAARRGVLDRSHGLCEVCGHERVEVVHHRLRRSQGGGNELENLLGLCRGCHDRIHDHPAWALAMGYLRKGVLDLSTSRGYNGD